MIKDKGTDFKQRLKLTQAKALAEDEAAALDSIIMKKNDLVKEPMKPEQVSAVTGLIDILENLSDARKQTVKLNIIEKEKDKNKDFIERADTDIKKLRNKLDTFKERINLLEKVMDLVSNIHKNLIEKKNIYTEQKTQNSYDIDRINKDANEKGKTLSSNIIIPQKALELKPSGGPSACSGDCLIF